MLVGGRVGLLLGDLYRRVDCLNLGTFVPLPYVLDYKSMCLLLDMIIVFCRASWTKACLFPLAICLYIFPDLLSADIKGFLFRAGNRWTSSWHFAITGWTTQVGDVGG